MVIPKYLSYRKSYSSPVSLYNNIDRSTDNDRGWGRKQPNCLLGVKWISEFHLAHMLCSAEKCNYSYTNNLDTLQNTVLGKQSK